MKGYLKSAIPTRPKTGGQDPKSNIETFLKSEIPNPISVIDTFPLPHSRLNCFFPCPIQGLKSHALYQNPDHFPAVPGQAPDAVSHP